MDVSILIQIGVGLVIVLAILFFIYYFSSKKQIIQKQSNVKKVNVVDLESLKKIIKNKESTTQQLSDAVDLIIKKYGFISRKVESRIHPDFDIYYEIMYKLCSHKNTNKRIILYFDKEMTFRNPDYKKELAEAMQKGLSNR